MAVTLETKCWGGDCDVLVKAGLLHRRFASVPKSVTQRQLVTNKLNQGQLDLVENWRRSSGLDCNVVNADALGSNDLAGIGLSRDSLGIGFDYSVAELAGLLFAKTKYLAHLASDVDVSDWNWLSAGVRLLEANPQIAVVNPIWNGLAAEAEKESVFADSHFYYGYGFSDQCYLVRVSDLRAPIYNTSSPLDSQFPLYGGDSFEKRVHAWMRTNRRLRATCKCSSYRHPVVRSLMNLAREAVGRYGRDITLEAAQSALTVEGRYTESESQLLAYAAEQAARTLRQGDLVEVGRHCGRSTACLGLTLQAVSPGKQLHAIDPHEGEIHLGQRVASHALAKLREALARFGLEGTVHFHVAKSTDLTWRVPVSFLHIVGIHGYDSVRADFMHFQPRLLPGAFVAFHGYEETVGARAYVDEMVGPGLPLEPWALTGNLLVLRYFG